MRFMILVKATETTEAGVLPTTDEMLAMGRFNEEMVDAGILLAADGLQASSKGARVTVTADKRTVVDGPFAETKELIAGYWLIEVKSFLEALEWAKRILYIGQDATYEVRQVFDVEDFGDALTPEVVQQVTDLEARAAAQRD